eukprot:CAMPEP_0172720014 /NCGR_PEP_ID=MMETSP1074-20121228/75941_1 /TAXON_ID=2916 /ORGANISM="Ceratium fusus, Strain PA161109" /LENGTH=66 /DNA_ID=CAMNT_0013545439 /DNA_START=323 /DNA_END=522 /DNA_ORIENTATION=-
MSESELVSVVMKNKVPPELLTFEWGFDVASPDMHGEEAAVAMARGQRTIPKFFASSGPTTAALAAA